MFHESPWKTFALLSSLFLQPLDVEGRRGVAPAGKSWLRRFVVGDCWAAGFTTELTAGAGAGAGADDGADDEDGGAGALRLLLL